jgi:hypothetical protein
MFPHFENWLVQLANQSQLWRQSQGVYQRNLNLRDELIKPLASYLDENDFQRILDKLTLGDFIVPVTTLDWSGNMVHNSINLTIVDAMLPLKEGWNLVSTPVTLGDGHSTWEEIRALGDGLLCIDAIRYDPVSGWVSVAPTDEIKPLQPIYAYIIGKDKLGAIFSREVTQPPMLSLESGWNLVSLAIPPVDWDSMPVTEAMVSLEQAQGNRGYSAVVSPEQTVTINDNYSYWDIYGQQYGFGGYRWYSQQNPWVYTVGSADVKKMSIGGGYWVFMEDSDTLAGFSTTPITVANFDESGNDLDPIVPRYNQERNSRTHYEEYTAEGYTKIYLTYSGDVSPSRVLNFYQQTMPERGWNVDSWEGLEDSASIDLSAMMGDAGLECHIDVVGGEGIDIVYECQEPGNDLFGVRRFDWGQVVMTSYSQTTDSTGVHTKITYGGGLDSEQLYKYYQDLENKMREWGYQLNWQKIGDANQLPNWAYLMFRRSDNEGRTYVCLLWIENGMVEIDHYQLAENVPQDYINNLIGLLWELRINMQ